MPDTPAPDPTIHTWDAEQRPEVPRDADGAPTQPVRGWDWADDADETEA